MKCQGVFTVRPAAAEAVEEALVGEAVFLVVALVAVVAAPGNFFSTFDWYDIFISSSQ